MTFHVGQKVVCVNDDLHAFVRNGFKYNNIPSGMKVGQVYTVRGIVDGQRLHPAWQKDGVYLVEIVRSRFDADPCEPPFAAARFRPVQDQGMSILRAILANPKRELEVAE